MEQEHRKCIVCGNDVKRDGVLLVFVVHNAFGANVETGPLEPPIKSSVSIYLLCEFLQLDSSLTQGLESGFPSL